MIILSLFHGIVIFMEHESQINKVKQVLEKQFILRNLACHIPFLKTEINWEGTTDIKIRHKILQSKLLI